jgi:hypothetical protein
MAVDDSTCIDIASVDPKLNHAVLTISDHLEWDESLEHQLTLQNKINAYLRFVESGEMVERLPRMSGLPVYFCIRFLHEPDHDGMIFLERAREVVESAGFHLTFKVG